MINLEATPIVLNSASQSGVIRIKDILTGILTTPATLDATTVIGFTACPTYGGTYTTCYDEYNTLIYITVTLNAAGTYNVPTSIMKNNFIKIFTCTTAGVAVNQTGDKTFAFIGKG
jgi:hypothetical protein